MSDIYSAALSGFKLYDLVVAHNVLAPLTGAKPIKRFRDRETAQASLRQVITQVCQDMALPSTTVREYVETAAKPPVDEPISGKLTKASKIRTLIRKGLTDDEVTALVNDLFGEDLHYQVRWYRNAMRRNGEEV